MKIVGRAIAPSPLGGVSCPARPGFCCPVASGPLAASSRTTLPTGNVRVAAAVSGSLLSLNFGGLAGPWPAARVCHSRLLPPLASAWLLHHLRPGYGKRPSRTGYARRWNVTRESSDEPVLRGGAQTGLCPTATLQQDRVEPVGRPTAVWCSRRPVSAIAGANNRGHLRRGNHRNVLQCTTGPNTNGYGSSGGSGSRGGAGSNTSSIPPCAEEPPANELCN
jgi:hypothetical protein